MPAFEPDCRCYFFLAFHASLVVSLEVFFGIQHTLVVLALFLVRHVFVAAIPCYLEWWPLLLVRSEIRYVLLGIRRCIALRSSHYQSDAEQEPPSLDQLEVDGLIDELDAQLLVDCIQPNPAQALSATLIQTVWDALDGWKSWFHMGGLLRSSGTL